MKQETANSTLTDEYLKHGASYERLLAEYRRHGSLMIAYDFDATVHDYHKTGESHQQVIKLIRDLKKIGCALVVWTAHPNLDYVNNYLVEHKIPFDSINEGGIPLPWISKKPFFSALLDDRAGLVSVYNDLTKLVKEINETKSSQQI